MDVRQSNSEIFIEFDGREPQPDTDENKTVVSHENPLSPGKSKQLLESINVRFSILK